ncbi:MAG: hypothetical protein Q9M10_05810, partial [Mariprofundaceae bacterium]|nr:hypothetical protein [Mariprofundaceae bacterium]
AYFNRGTSRNQYAAYTEKSADYVENMERLLNPLSEASLERLNAEFNDVLSGGVIEQVLEWPHNDDECYQHLPRLRMQLDQHRMNMLPQMIRRINALYQTQGNDHVSK